MDKKEFSEQLCKGVAEKLKEKGYEVEANVSEVLKNNGIVYTGLQFHAEEGIQPVIYIDGLYKGFENGAWDMDQAVDQAVGIYEQGKTNISLNIDDLLDYSKVKDHLTVVVRNAEKNAELLKDTPHEIHEDLAEMYRIEVETNDGSTGSVLIKNNIMEKLGVDQATLKADAWACMKANNPGQMKSMIDTLIEIAGDKFGEEMGTEMVEQMGSESDPMYVYTNQDKVNGAVYMLDKEAMTAVAEKLGESFAILPSSIHECIILPESAVSDYGVLKSMVEEVNATQVAEDEVLSDNVYRFDKNTQELSMVETGPTMGQGITM